MPTDVIATALRRLGVDSQIVAQVPRLPVGVRGVLVYGSRARGDAIPGSDLDLLALVDVPRASMVAGDVSISYYTASQLRTGVGTLFGAHLRRDAKVIHDPEGALAGAIHALGEVDTDRLLVRARAMTELFSSLDQDLPRYLPGLLREARYLLRSCLYAIAISDGSACFSVRELAARLEDPDLVRLLASRQEGEPEVEDLHECLRRLDSLLGSFPPSSHGSLEATIVNEWNRPGDLLSMAFLALGVTGQGTGYAEVDKILL